MTTHIPSLTLPGFIFENAAASILLPVALGTAIGFSTRPDRTKETYARLRQPPYSPPAWLFGPAWTSLYAAMGLASHLAYTSGTRLTTNTLTANAATVASTKHGATLYTIQLALNLVWMPLWFGALKPVAATADLVLLSGTVGYLTYVWSKIDERAAWLMVPYLGWLSFATYLSAGTGYLNDWDFEKDVKLEKDK